MASPALHVGSVVTCSHAGSAAPETASSRVTVSGQAVVTLADVYSVTGCSLSGSGSPPCATGNWVTGATRVTTDGTPVACTAGSSTCVPTGNPLLPVATQPRVLVT
jgi:uncharacterized Zn-binding protein involved in type VI secretion